MTLGVDLGLFRPWLSLYGNLLKVPESAAYLQGDLAPIQAAVPNELMTHIFDFLDPYSLGKASLVCRQWRTLAEHPRLWRRACDDAFRLAVPTSEARHKLMATQYRFSWKRMFVHHPHLRFDGLYAARNTYVRTGVVEFSNHRPVHLVTYYRYFRFLPDGTLQYRTSPAVIGKVARSFVGAGGQGPGPRLPGGGGGKKGDGGEADRYGGGVLSGRYVVRGSTVCCSLVYPNSSATELRCRLALRSTHPGANNRLDIAAIVTFDTHTGAATQLQPAQQQPDSSLEQDPPSARAHSRGLASCVFVPWDQVATSPLNLPPSQMDFMIV